MPTIELLRSFLEQANARGSRSTTVAPLSYLISMLLVALLIMLGSSAPDWAVKTVGGALLFVIGLYAIAYVFFMLKSPDMLRSEAYVLNKLQIEKSMYGDSQAGMIDNGARRLEAAEPTLAITEQREHE